MEIGWIYCGFSGANRAIANFVVWISLFFPVHPTAIISNYCYLLYTRKNLTTCQQDVFKQTCSKLVNKL